MVKNSSILSYTFLKKINYILLGISSFLTIQIISIFISFNIFIEHSNIENSIINGIMTMLELNMAVSLTVLFSCVIIIAFIYIKEKTRKALLSQNMSSMIQKMDIVSMIKDNSYDIRKKV